MSSNDDVRAIRLDTALREAGLDAMVCALPANVLLLTGYWPVMGTSVAIFSQQGATVIVPRDEAELAEQGWAQVLTYEPSSLQSLKSPSAELLSPLYDAMACLTMERVGYEDEAWFEPASYVSMHHFGADMSRLLEEAFPHLDRVPCDAVLRQLRAVCSPHETERVRTACEVAALAFREGSSRLAEGMREVEVAELFRAGLGIAAIGRNGTQRADGYAFCMSGENSAQAGGAYARSRGRKLQHGDLVLVHCNSYVDGFWTDITRTYCVGTPHELERDLYEAVFAARAAALARMQPGERAADVDAAARQELVQRGYASNFRHATGHGVGFSAVDHDARPRLHPASPDVLEAGMICIVEPAIYLEGYGGVRHCDVVRVTEGGAEVLTPFQCDLEELVRRT